MNVVMKTVNHTAYTSEKNQAILVMGYLLKDIYFCEIILSFLKWTFNPSVPPEIVIWTYVTFDNNFDNDFALPAEYD